MKIFNNTPITKNSARRPLFLSAIIGVVLFLLGLLFDSSIFESNSIRRTFAHFIFIGAFMIILSVLLIVDMSLYKRFEIKYAQIRNKLAIGYLAVTFLAILLGLVKITKDTNSKDSSSDNHGFLVIWIGLNIIITFGILLHSLFSRNNRTKKS
jgi:uncharacterized membrane protein